MDSVKNKESKEPFVIDDDFKADWAFERLSETNKKIEDIDKQRAEYLKIYKTKLDEWFQSQTRELKRDQQSFRLMIEGYAATKPDRKVKTPSGQVYQTTSKNYIRDDKQFSEFMRKEHPEFMDKVKWQEFKATTHEHDGKIFDANGEEVPGVIVHKSQKTAFKFPKVKKDGDQNENH
ncbi:MAG TPA: hypothetical protein DDW71_00625 [Lactobacillus sp.]|nr:hypothetical protein [Lactobacillus sp.]